MRWRTPSLPDRAVRVRNLTRAYQLVVLTRAFDRREAEAAGIGDANAATTRVG
jgi:hypothetical protein